MIVDFRSFTRRGLMVDHVKPGGGVMHRKSRWYKTRKEVKEDRDTNNLSAMGK